MMAESSSIKWAVLIGIDDYHESLGSLKYAGADCRALRETLVSGPLGFPEDQVVLLDDTQETDKRPTFANIHNVLSSWLAVPDEDDLVLVYFAGHGRLVDGKTYLVPGDATLASIHTLGIPLAHAQDVVERCNAKRKLLILDACHSGAGRDVAAMTGEMEALLSEVTGIYTISSCATEELSHEWGDKKRGVFSYYLSEALTGGCSPDASGRLTVDHLYAWVHDHVRKWAAKHGCRQTPQRFTKGAGTVVLGESAPDYAALAEEYRRELEETKARLAETALDETRERVVHQERAKEKGATRCSRLTRVSHTLSRANKKCAALPWPLWIFIFVTLPWSWALAAWAHFARQSDGDYVSGYGVLNFFLAVVFLVVGFGGQFFRRWSDKRAGLVALTAGLYYGIVALAAGFVWPAAFVLPLVGCIGFIPSEDNQKTRQ